MNRLNLIRCVSIYCMRNSWGKSHFTTYFTYLCSFTVDVYIICESTRSFIEGKFWQDLTGASQFVVLFAVSRNVQVLQNLTKWCCVEGWMVAYTSILSWVRPCWVSKWAPTGIEPQCHLEPQWGIPTSGLCSCVAFGCMNVTEVTPSDRRNLWRNGSR